MSATAGRLRMRWRNQRRERKFAMTFVVGAALLACCAGCVLPTKSSTPGLSRARFRLPEAEWGPTSQQLVIVCYRSRTTDSLLFNNVHPPESFRVCAQSGRGMYVPQNETLKGGVGLFIGFGVIWPGARVQAEPVYVVITAQGPFGVYNPKPEK